MKLFAKGWPLSSRWLRPKLRWPANLGLPLRALLISLVVILPLWGRFLSSNITLSPDANAQTVNPNCRAGTAELTCQASITSPRMVDAGAPAWQSSPAYSFFHTARDRGEGTPQWNPYIGSGYPIGVDGLHAASSPTQWVHSHFPGDQGRDVVAFARFLSWTMAIVWAVGLLGASNMLLFGVAIAAALAPFPASYVDIVFLDADMLGPWFLLLIVAYLKKRLSFATACKLALALGLFVGTMAFPQAKFVLLCAMGVLVLTAVPATRGRSLAIVACLGVGVLALLPTWLPIVRNLDQFISSRDVMCVAEIGTGRASLWPMLTHPALFVPVTTMGMTLAGLVLLPFVPRKLAFAPVALVVLVAWLTLGLPHRACSLPLVSGLRFARDLVPHIEMLFIFAVGAAAHNVSQRFDRRVSSFVGWIAFAAAGALSFKVAIDTQSALGEWRTMLGPLVGVWLGTLAFGWRQSWVRARRSAMGFALTCFAFPPYWFGSDMARLFFVDGQESPEIAPLITEVDPSTPLGMMQKRSREEDRRHFSPAAFLFPNWSAAFDVLDLRSINGLYPAGFHELNAGLFSSWERDPQHVLNPDRFIRPVPAMLATSIDFQRVLAVNRVSLLTFANTQATFAAPPSPYEAEKCDLLGRSSLQGAETYVCREIGGVGFFPSVVKVVGSRTEALDMLRSLTPKDILQTALIGPEVDLPRDGSPLTGGSGTVVSVRRAGDDLTYVLDVRQAGVFVIADTYFRGWTAKINGRPAAIARANVAFKAVNVPVGHVDLALHFAIAAF